MTRGVCLALACACVAAALLFARPVSTPGPALRDFEAYWSAGAAWNAGEDAYARAVWTAQRRVPGVDESRDEVLPFVGPPATLPLWGMLARLPYATAAALWWSALALALLALLLLLSRAVTGGIAPLGVFTLLVLALGFGPMTSDLALGQVALLALLGATACVVWASPVVASLGAFVAFLQPNVAIGLLSQFGRNRATAALAIAAIGTYVVGAAGAGWAWPLSYAGVLASHAAAERFTAIQISPAAIAYGFGMQPQAASLAGYAIAVAAIVAGVAIVQRLPDAFARFAAISALVPLAAGFFHEHDLVVAFVAVAWCAWRCRGMARALAAGGTLLVAIDWLGLAQRPSGIEQSVMLAVAALAAFAAFGDAADLRPTLSAGAAVLPLFALAAFAAVAHPAPVWPDALGAFHALPNASIAEVWKAEQQRTGLLTPQPTWALLRLLSLTGCIMLGAAVLRQAQDDTSTSSG